MEDKVFNPFAPVSAVIESIMSKDRVEEAKAKKELLLLAKQYGALIRSKEFSEISKLMEQILSTEIEKLVAAASAGKDVRGKAERVMFLMELVQKPYLQIWKDSMNEEIESY